MTKEEWKQIEDELVYGLHHSITLRCDEHIVYLVLSRANMRLKIMILLKDADLAGIITKKHDELSDKEREIMEKLFCKKTKNSINKSELSRSKLSKREKEKILSMNKKYVYYSPYFTSFNTLRRTLEKNCKAVERVMDR